MVGVLRRLSGLAAGAAALAVAPAAAGALTVGTGAASPALRVDARGSAEVSWSAGGRRVRTLVPAAGALVRGGRLAGADVSRPVRGEHVPFQRVLRTGPGGWWYALQARRLTPGGPVALRFSRWRGVPTEVSLTAALEGDSVRLAGRVTLDERPLPAAAAQRARVTLEAWNGRLWSSVATLPLDAEGRYLRLVPHAASVTLYRALVPGPNLGATRAPDAAAEAPPLVRDR